MFCLYGSGLWIILLLVFPCFQTLNSTRYFKDKDVFVERSCSVLVLVLVLVFFKNCCSCRWWFHNRPHRRWLILLLPNPTFYVIRFIHCLCCSLVVGLLMMEVVFNQECSSNEIYDFFFFFGGVLLINTCINLQWAHCVASRKVWLMAITNWVTGIEETHVRQIGLEFCASIQQWMMAIYIFENCTISAFF